MLQKFILCALFLALSITAFAQDDDFHKVEGFVGYSNNQVDTGLGDEIRSFNTTTNSFNDDFFDNRQGFHGVNVAVTGNVSRYIGIRGDFSANYKTYDFNTPTFTTPPVPSQNVRVRASIYNVLGGIQVKDNAKEGSRFRPFGYALVGVGVARSKVDNDFLSTGFCQQAGVDCRDGFSETESGLAAAFGGGLDIKATRRISIRAFQVDYNPTRIAERTQNNLRFGFGVVFH